MLKKQFKKKITMLKFRQLINTSEPVLVFFFHETEGVRQAMSPILQEISKITNGKAKVVKMEIDKNKQVADYYKISAISETMLFKNGQLVWRSEGHLTSEKLIEIINKNIELHTA